jgi:hypothetical protein
MSVPVWTMPNSSGLVSEELPGDHYGSNGIVPPFPLEIEIQWKEKGDEYSWVSSLTCTACREFHIRAVCSTGP